MSVRVRFAPSPTGYLHIGGARTALFNYLYARHTGGKFILRVEDTDRERSTPESIRAILDSLQWLGLEWDEGPFFQSERGDLYRARIEQLLKEGRAYRCYCTAEELERKRQQAIAEGRKPMYDRSCRDRRDAPKGAPHVIRFKTPLAGETIVDDLIHGTIVFANEEFDDLVLVRTDGSPTYNFCAAVDDAEMAITHIIRGEDHLANTPKQIQIHQALGHSLPRFGHVPLIHGLDRARLSKRHGATSVTAYRERGYLPDALVNYLVRLGWSCGDQEIFTRAELIEKFSLESIGKAAAVFNPEKLEWVNFQHIKMMPAVDLANAVRPFVEARGWEIPADPGWLEGMVVTLRERAKTLVELVEMGRYYFGEDVEIEPEAQKHLARAPRAALEDLRSVLASITTWNIGEIQRAFEEVMARHHLKLGKLAQPVRIALTGGTVSPGIFEVIEVLGRRRTLARLDRALPLVESV